MLQQRRYANGYGGGPQSPGQVGPQPGHPEDPSDENSIERPKNRVSDWRPTMIKMVESAATTMVSLFVLG